MARYYLSLFAVDFMSWTTGQFTDAMEGVDDAVNKHGISIPIPVLSDAITGHRPELQGLTADELEAVK